MTAQIADNTAEVASRDQVAAEVAGALAKLGAAALVANAQAQNYQRLVADINT